VPNRNDAKLLQRLVRQAGKNRLVYVILAECRLIPSEAQAPQPDHDVHEGAPQSVVACIICRGCNGVQGGFNMFSRILIRSKPKTHRAFLGGWHSFLLPTPRGQTIPRQGGLRLRPQSNGCSPRSNKGRQTLDDSWLHHMAGVVNIPRSKHLPKLSL
jgi:hypothetical protein